MPEAAISQFIIRLDVSSSPKLRLVFVNEDVDQFGSSKPQTPSKTLFLVLSMLPSRTFQSSLLLLFQPLAILPSAAPFRRDSSTLL